MSNFARLSFARRASNQTRRVCLPHQRRSYATSRPPNQGGNSRLLLIAMTLGVPTAFYMWPRSSSKSEDKNARLVQDPAYDEPRAMGSHKGPNSMSYKQEGLSNGDTMNPFVNEPGKSKKGEGETETAKVKGTVSPTRPQV